MLFDEGLGILLGHALVLTVDVVLHGLFGLVKHFLGNHAALDSGTVLELLVALETPLVGLGSGQGLLLLPTRAQELGKNPFVVT